MPALATRASFWLSGCGAESVPRKNFGLPDVAAAASARLLSAELMTGLQYSSGRIPFASRSERSQER